MGDTVARAAGANSGLSARHDSTDNNHNRNHNNAGTRPRPQANG